MTTGNLRQHLEEFYSGESPPAETVDRLRHLAHADATGVHLESHRGQGAWWSPSMTGMAASLAMILSAASFYVVITRTTPSSQPRIVRTGGSDWPVPITNASMNHPQDMPNLVAVKFQIDGCPMAAAVEPVFCELIKKFSDKQVFFARYDMSDSVNRRLSANLASGLGINWACQGASQSGTILLIDRNSCEVVAKLTNRQGLPHMVATLDRMIH